MVDAITSKTVSERHGRKMVVLNTSGGESSCILTVTKFWVRFSGLYTHPNIRRKGNAKTLLERVILDYSSIPICIEVDPMYLDEVDGPNELELRVFYGRYGFDDVEGHPYAMIRPAGGPN